jgi:hypothetical protein
MTLEAYSKNLQCDEAPAYTTLAAAQYHAVTLDSSNRLVLCSSAGQVAQGILQGAPAAGQMGQFAYGGLSLAVYGDTVTINQALVTDASGHLVPKTTLAQNIIAIAMQPGASGEIHTVRVVAQSVSASGARLREATVDITAAQLIALNATIQVLVDASALVASGEIASGDTLVFQGAVAQMYGGTEDYDTDGDLTVRYTALNGTVVSLTVDDFCNDGTAGSCTSIKPLATDVALTASTTGTTGDLVIQMSASPTASCASPPTIPYSRRTPNSAHERIASHGPPYTE